ncbi:MAG: nuclear transport factor 2 family protein [Planctomycetes bacterium]|nr:nuclear transport factor 2 family protein [Planctomycetota bacterium]
MRKAMTLGFTVCMLLALAACGGGNNSSSSSSGGGSGGGGGSGPDFSTPVGTLKELAAAFEANDLDRILACYDKAFLEKKEEDGTTTGDKFRAQFKEIQDAGGSLKWSFNEADVKIEGDTASCKGKMKIKPGKDDKEMEEDESMTLVKKDGKWWCNK